jgi:hypothetical protein
MMLQGSNDINIQGPRSKKKKNALVIKETIFTLIK